MSTFYVHGRLDNVDTIVYNTMRQMRSCGVLGQEAALKRDQVRKDLAVIGFSTFVENGSGKNKEVYCFILPTPHYVVYPAVGEIPARRATVTGFSLSPAKDWAVVEYFVVPDSVG